MDYMQSPIRNDKMTSASHVLCVVCVYVYVNIMINLYDIVTQYGVVLLIPYKIDGGFEAGERTDG